MINWKTRIRALREDADLTQKELAEKLGISERTLFRYENAISEPTITVIIKLAEFFNVTCDYLIGFDRDSVEYLSSYKKENVEVKNKIRGVIFELRSILDDKFQK